MKQQALLNELLLSLLPRTSVRTVLQVLPARTKCHAGVGLCPADSDCQCDTRRSSIWQRPRCRTNRLLDSPRSSNTMATHPRGRSLQLVLRNMAYVATSESKADSKLLWAAARQPERAQVSYIISPFQKFAPCCVLLCIGRLPLVADAADLML
jgi:hypothetical protein